MCHLYRRVERPAAEPARDLSTPPSPLRLRPRRIAAGATAVAAVAALAAVLWPSQAPSSTAAGREAVPVAAAAALPTSPAYSSLDRSVPARATAPVALEQAGAGVDDDVPSSARAHGAGGECGHSL